MRILPTIFLTGLTLVSGCIVYRPRERVVEREYVREPSGQVERETVVVDEPPPVIEVTPYFGSVWVYGGWHYGHGGRYWGRGHWR